MRGITLLVICTFLVTLSCKNNKNLILEEENFDVFYDRFHSDMEFQMKRIQFPLEGGSAQVEGTIPWTRDNWITMKVKIYDVDKNQYEVYYERKEDVFIQGFQLRESGFSAEYRFKKIDKKWYLVYALDTNL